MEVEEREREDVGVVREADFLVEEGEEVDEGEMRRVVLGRVGGWVDWAVGWLDLRGEGDEEGEGEGDEEDGREGRGGGKWKGGVGVGVEINGDYGEMDGDGGVMMAPGVEEGILGDARWLLKVVGKVVL